jgi:hypothetical protein
MDETELSSACVWPGQSGVCGWEDWPKPAIDASLLAELGTDPAALALRKRDCMGRGEIDEPALSDDVAASSLRADRWVDAPPPAAPPAVGREVSASDGSSPMPCVMLFWRSSMRSMFIGPPPAPPVKRTGGSVSMEALWLRLWLGREVLCSEWP